MQVGKYQIDREIGRGGFGRVYRAFDPTVGRWVALKVLTAAGEKELTARFRNEAVAAGNLHHENIVTIYEFGEHEGSPFIAMEFIDGEDLQHIISSQRPLTLFEKVRILCQVAAGLQCAHHNGVVHRDVKPANVMLQPNGVVKIMDFGIARLTRSTSTRLTQTGYLIGTVMYMAPEQFNNSQVDALCDIFSYGIISYELLTGRHPFYAPDTGAVIYRLTNHDPPVLTSLLPDCPPDLEKVVAGALQKDRELRYQTLQELLYDLEPVLADLRGARCNALMKEALGLFETESFELAQTKVREVLELDSVNREARQLRDTLNQEMQRRSVRSKVEALLESADKEVEAKRFSDAVTLLEQARRLARGDSVTENRVLKTRTLIEHRQQSDRLVIRAREELHKKDLSGAYRNVAEALRIDPANTDAGFLLKSIQSEIGSRERERETQDALAKVRGLVLLQDFNQALAVLTDLESKYGSSEATTEQKAYIEKELANYDRRETLRKETSKVKELLRSDRLDEAAATLSGLQAAFPDDRQVADLLAYARQEMANRVKKREVEYAIARSKQALDRSDFQAAVEQLEEALRRYPSEKQLMHVLETTVNARLVFERERAVSTTMRRCAELRGDKRFNEALALVAATLESYPGEALLVDLQQQIQQDSQAEERVENIRKITRDARHLTEQGNPRAAVAALRRAAAQYPADQEIESILAQTEAEVRRQDIETSMARARQLSEQADLPAAISVIEHMLMTYPLEPRLVALQEHYKNQKDAADKTFALKEAARRCEALRGEHRYSEAIELARLVLKRYVNDTNMLDLIRQLEADRSAHERLKVVQDALQQAQHILDSGQPSTAVERLEHLNAEYPNEASIEGLLTKARLAVEEEAKDRSVRDALQLAVSVEQLQGPLAALQVIEKALKQCPANSALQTTATRLRQASEELADQQRSLARQAVLLQASNLLSTGELEKAEELVRGWAGGQGKDAQLEGLLGRIQEEKRAKQYHDGRERVRQLAESGNFQEALKEMSDLLMRFPGDIVLEDDARNIQHRREQQRHQGPDEPTGTNRQKQHSSVRGTSEEPNREATRVQTNSRRLEDSSFDDNASVPAPHPLARWQKITFATVGLAVMLVFGLIAYRVKTQRSQPEPPVQQAEKVRPDPVEVSPPVPVEPPPLTVPPEPIGTSEKKTEPHRPPKPRTSSSATDVQSRRPDKKELPVIRQQPPPKPIEALSVPSRTEGSSSNVADLVQPAPPPMPTQTVETPRPEVLPSGPYTGLRKGQLRWTGAAPPSARVTIEGLNPSVGVVRGNRFPPLEVQLRVEPPDVKVITSPSAANRWIIALEMPPRRVDNIVIFWEIKRQ